MAEEGKSIEKYAKLFELADNGFVLRETPKLRGNRAYFYFIKTDGSEKENYSIESIDAEEFNDLTKELTEYIKKRQGFSYYNSSRSVGGNRGERKREKQENKVRMNDAMKQYDKNFAAQMLLLAKKQEWFTEIIEQLGITALFMILQIAHIPAEQWYEKLREYKKDPEEFLKFADKWMVALYDAKEDAEKYLKLRQKYVDCIGREIILKSKVIEYKKLTEELSAELNAAISLIPRNGLQRFSLWLALRKMSQAAVVTEEELEEEEE